LLRKAHLHLNKYVITVSRLQVGTESLAVVDGVLVGKNTFF
jgi:hypothetical protein